ncbi:kinase-like domain-containing protein [Glomus cerebriforme]|uniref:Kinase-like domain-containing protein n=1 Tax=Glomus cerebriforme TaxID=658196 RepID=A0A397T561_9GLOM|nr:kinase-like domain-containing protein [Glomus cerebriforme]
MDTELDMGKYGVSSSRSKKKAGSQASGWNVEDNSTATLISDFKRLNIDKERLERYADEAGDARYASKINTKKLRESSISKTLANIDLSMQVDLCFVLDCTGSMGRHIAAAKDCILQVVNYMERTNPSIKLWVGFCGYRDHCDSSKRIQIFNFTNSYSQFKRYISNEVPATGGGDEPEDVLGGLNAAVNNMNWRHTTRVLLHVGDAPPHGRRFTSLSDSYPHGDPNGLTAESVLGKMKSANIIYYFGKITDKTDKMLRVFSSIIGEFPVFELSTIGGDPNALINKFFKATCTAIASSVSLTSTMEKGAKGVYMQQKKKLEMDPNQPKWHTLPVETGKVSYYRLPESLSDIKNPDYFTNKSNLINQNFSYKRAPKPFSVGAERYAYYALNVTNGASDKNVMKEYLDVGKKANSIERYLETVEVSTVAHFLSLKFNSAAERVDIHRKVKFLKVQLLRKTSGSDTRCYTVERLFNGAEFKRFNVNSGVITEFHSTLEAFAHFTYEHTGGYLVVYDLQGIELEDKFLLTDPAVHCTDSLRFGRTNLGKKGIEKCFLANHKCSSVCQKLGLTPRS